MLTDCGREAETEEGDSRAGEPGKTERWIDRQVVKCGLAVTHILSHRHLDNKDDSCAAKLR